MNAAQKMFVASTLATSLAWFAGRCSAPQTGIKPEDAAELVRRAGDSAVASYRKDIGDVIGPLEDSVRFYRGKATAGARIVVAHAGGSAHRAPALPVPDTAARSDTSTAHLVADPIVQNGVTITQDFTISPTPRRFEQNISWQLDPDTILVAILQTPEGLTRFTAAGTTAGLRVSVADAAALKPKDAHGRNVWDWLGAGSCVLAGVTAAKEQWGTAAGAGGACGLLLWRPKIRLPHLL